MGKDRIVHEVVEELMEVYGINEKALGEKVGVSELVVRNYLSGSCKDSRSYTRFKGKVKEAFGLDEEFFGEGHVWVPSVVEKKTKEEKPVKSVEKKSKKEKPAKSVEKNAKEETSAKSEKKKVDNRPKERAEKKPSDRTENIEKKSAIPEDGVQLVFDQKGQISEEIEEIVQEAEEKSDKNAKVKTGQEIEKKPDKNVEGKNGKKNTVKKQQDTRQDSLLSAIKLSGSKAKLSGKKKDITPENAVKWAAEYEEEMKQYIGKAFDVLKESIKGNFTKEETKPEYANKKIAEIVELSSKVKEDDLNLIIAMLKKMIF